MRSSFTNEWIRTAWITGILLIEALLLVGCSDDPTGPPDVAREPTFSATFADGDFRAAFQLPNGGGYMAAGTGAVRQGFIYRLGRNGQEMYHYVFDRNGFGETVHGVLPLDGGGYIVCGKSDEDGWVAMIDDSLRTEWGNQYIGSARTDRFAAMAARPGGGFLLGGEHDWDWTGGTGDGWLVKLTSSGLYESQKTFGGAWRDYVSAIVPSGDGGFFFGGSTLPPMTADERSWICKTNAAADSLVWDRSYIFEHSTGISGIAPTSDGGCICVGSTLRMETPHTGASDAYILRVDAGGGKLWSSRSGLDGLDGYYAIVPAHDGGYVCAGVRYDTGSGWLVKIDENGITVWERTFPGGVLYSIERTSGRGYVCGGTRDGKAWLLRVDAAGNHD